LFRETEENAKKSRTMWVSLEKTETMFTTAMHTAPTGEKH